jgi:dihydropyrimidinase
VARLIIRGGTVLTADSAEPADVLIEDQRVVGLAAARSELSQAFAESADRVLEAAGRYVLPGGVDAHTHMELPVAGTVASDSFETGTRAAIWGGTTTIVDFASQIRGGSLHDALESWRLKAEGNCAADYGFHMGFADVNESSLREMDQLVDEGVTSFKLYMAYPGVSYSTDGQILAALQHGAHNRALIQIHAENGIATELLVAQALARGEVAPRFHSSTRPAVLEGEATHRAIQLARVAGASLYIVHVSAAAALAEVVGARDRGQPVFAETCPQYLFLSEDDLARDGFEGAKFVCSPPLRSSHDQLALWRGLHGGDLSVVATDHCPFRFQGQKDLGRGDFSKIPNGLPGVEHRMNLIHQGVVRGMLSLTRWVDVTSTSPAKMFGMYPRKGSLRPGADADVVIYDPSARSTISASTHHMAVDYSCYEGMEISGRVETVLLRGSVVLDRGQYVGRRGDGRFIVRGFCQYPS